MIKKEKNNLNFLLSFLIIIILVSSIIFLSQKEEKNQNFLKEKETFPKEITNQPISWCFYLNEQKILGDYYGDKAWLKINILKDKVSGEFHFLPAETDSKIGKFEGKIENSLEESRIINVWWDSFAEGMDYKEELIIKLNQDKATVGFGEMIQKVDGSYVYKDKENLFYLEPMKKVNCDLFNEELDVENYLKDNIKEVATNQPVLGGTWYVISTQINLNNKTGEIIYEDGHIQSKASFSYSYDKITQKVQINNFILTQQ